MPNRIEVLYFGVCICNSNIYEYIISELMVLLLTEQEIYSKHVINCLII